MQFTDQNFSQEVENFVGVALVDFFAAWCGPCKMQGPIIDELANEITEPNIKIGKLDVDQNQQITQKYSVLSIPTLIIFKNGAIAETLVGLQNKEALKNKLKNLL